MVKASKLSAEQHRITQQCGTEPPFSGAYLDHHEVGVYCCIVCANKLFNSANKYDSGSGWPSFWQAVEDGKGIRSRTDSSHGMERVEILCGQCDAHLGHVFTDGPKPSGMRYCINSVSMNFLPALSEE